MSSDVPGEAQISVSSDAGNLVVNIRIFLLDGGIRGETDGLACGEVKVGAVFQRWRVAHCCRENH